MTEQQTSGSQRIGSTEGAKFDREEACTALLSYIGRELVADPIGGESGAERSLGAGDDLLGSGLLDSLAVMRLIQEIESRFGLVVPPVDVTIENFMTVDRIVSYLESLWGSGDRSSG